jgi:hypothetical protein
MSFVVGVEFGIKLQTIGPGEYASPPEVLRSAVRFLGASFVRRNS